MNEPASGSFQTSQREVQTALSSDVEMSIRKTDWKRVHRKVKGIPRETSVYEIVENVAWGVSGSALLSLLPLYQATQSTEPWVKPTFWIVAIAACLVAVLAHHFRKERRATIQSSCEEVLADMSEVYQTFFPSEGLS
jgi:hypothetical protein